MASAEDAEEFIDRVDEVTLLIEGLKDGTLPAEYVDTREEEIYERERKKEEAKEQERLKEEERKFDNLPKEKQEELLKKVEDLQRNKERKEKLRAAFEAHMAERERKTVEATDYHAWDLWTPSDEEDDLYNNLTPNSAEFKAMEKDIEERHAKLLRSRQYAERQRQLGNTFFKEKQYAKALQVYEDGIASEKSNMALNANAAAAALKLGCNIQAIEHCDKVFSIADFCFENKPSTVPMRLKAYQRRATARSALKHFREAISDLEEARKLAGQDDKEVNQQLQKVQRTYDEHKVGKKLKKALEKDEESEGGDMESLRRIAKLSRSLQGEAASVREACEALADLLQGEERDRIFARECGVLNKVLQVYLEGQKTDNGGEGALKPEHPLNVLRSACLNDQNAVYVCEYPKFLEKSVAGFAKSTSADEDLASLHVFHSCSIESEPRKKLGVEMRKNDPCVTKLCGLVDPKTPPQLLLGALQLLGNVCLHTPFRGHVVASQGSWDTVGRCLAILGEKSLVSSHEAVGSLLGNLCSDPKLRQSFADKEAAIRSLLNLMRMKPLNTASAHRFPKLLAIVTNLSVSERAQEALCRCGGVLRLLDLLQAQPSHTREIVQCICRLSKIEAGARTLASAGNLTKLFGKVKEAGGGDEATDDALVRASANVVMKSGLDLPSCADLLLPLGLYDLLRRAIAAPASATDLLVGNPALCVSELARDSAVLARLDAMGAIDLIEPLTKVAHKRTGSAQRNAGIALARLAKCGKDGEYIEKLREHHAFEIIAKYVKI